MTGLPLIFMFILAIVCMIFLISKFKRPDKEETQEEEAPVNKSIKEYTPLDLNDEDATVACLVAAIECRNEAHKNVQIKSVRRIS